jgi:hypothetical protein
VYVAGPCHTYTHLLTVYSVVVISPVAERLTARYPHRMTATLDQIHADPTIIDRAISLSERLDILAAGMVKATLMPTKNASTAEAADFDTWLAASTGRARGKLTTEARLMETRGDD